MKISDFNPNKQTPEFFHILHPVTGEPLKDEDGVEIGFYTYSDNSKKGSSSKSQMHTNILRRKYELVQSMGRPVTDQNSSTAEVAEVAKWDEDNSETIKSAMLPIIQEEFVSHLARCCTGLQGSIETDSSDSPSILDVLNENSWIADQLISFRSELSNWVPKQPGS